MPKETWIIAGALTVALLLGLLGFSSCEKKRQAEQAQAQLEEARATTTRAQAELEDLKAKLNDAKSQIDGLQKEKETAVQSHRTLEDELRAALESKDVTISKLQGKLTVNILDRVLFDSGEAELKTDGATVLRKVADLLAQHPQLKIHVIGHTDNVPIRAGARSRFVSNCELSAARALAAVRFLTEKAGVDPARLGAVAYGEFRPVADNATPEGRARNRRIAITILSEELAGSDTTVKPAATPSTPASAEPPVAVTNAPANSPSPSPAPTGP
jgi:chemotaxis protein MotB